MSIRSAFTLNIEYCPRGAKWDFCGFFHRLLVWDTAMRDYRELAHLWETFLSVGGGGGE